MKAHLLALLMMVAPLQALGEETLYYPRPEAQGDARADYPVKLLELAFSKAGVRYQLKPSPLTMLQSRSLLELDGTGKFINIAWTMSSKEREALALPIRIPIDKGLLGWRLLLVRKADRDLFRNVQATRDLLQYSSGQGHDWPDTPILRGNGLSVIESPLYGLLFRMLDKGQFTFFPRSVGEVWGELDAYGSDKLVVADHIVLHYASPQYFFVGKKDTKLAADITRGLEVAIADGSFETLFNDYYGEQIRRAGLDKRRVIELANPALPAGTPLARPELWFKPGRSQ